MRLKAISIHDFKRFSDLTISDIPESAKLVVLTGPNGCGKTSVFEAMNYWVKFSALRTKFYLNYDKEYYKRFDDSQKDNEATTYNKIQPVFHEITENNTIRPELITKAFYIRSAYRHEADFTTNGLSRIGSALDDEKRMSTLITPEARVSDNYQRMVGKSIDILFNSKDQRNRTAEEITTEIIGVARDAMRSIFEDLVLEGPGNPLDGGTFRFTKGDTFGFHYKNLSGGEKAAFDLLLDFVIKRQAFDDTIYCIDEPELHMHTRLQAKLLEQIFTLIPDDCQLWLATHSIGMARKAVELYQKNPQQVVFIDFHDQDFDKPVTLTPVEPNRIFWKKMFETALGDLAELTVPQYVVFCEGKRLEEGQRKPGFDSAVYRTIFSSRFPNVEFISLGGTSEIDQDAKKLTLFLNQLAPSVKTWNIFDRDDRHEEEIPQLQEVGTQVLLRRDLESYLWDDEILKALCVQQEQPDKFEELKRAKDCLLAELPSKNRLPDDIKAISGQLYNKCKNTLQLTQCGDKAETFAIHTLAPLITPDTSVYQELESIVLGPLRR